MVVQDDRPSAKGFLIFCAFGRREVGAGSLILDPGPEFCGAIFPGFSRVLKSLFSEGEREPAGHPEFSGSCPFLWGRVTKSGESGMAHVFRATALV
jgi:hypothetical protein